MSWVQALNGLGCGAINPSRNMGGSWLAMPMTMAGGIEMHVSIHRLQGKLHDLAQRCFPDAPEGQELCAICTVQGRPDPHPRGDTVSEVSNYKLSLQASIFHIFLWLLQRCLVDHSNCLP